MQISSEWNRAEPYCAVEIWLQKHFLLFIWMMHSLCHNYNHTLSHSVHFQILHYVIYNFTWNTVTMTTQGCRADRSPSCIREECVCASPPSHLHLAVIAQTNESMAKKTKPHAWVMRPELKGMLNLQFTCTKCGYSNRWLTAGLRAHRLSRPDSTQKTTGNYCASVRL